MESASFIEHRFLSATTTLADVELLCHEAAKYHFAAVCVPPMFVKKAKELTAGTSVKTATVIGFPFGYNAIEAKLAETVLAIVDGADELSMVINLVALKNKDWQYLAKEINTILAVIRKSGKLIKVIIEAGLLNDEEIIACCDIYGAAGVDFIQTSTGYADKLVDLKRLMFIRSHLADAVKIMAGDPVDAKVVNDWIAAGAVRITRAGPEQEVYKKVAVQDGLIFKNEDHNKN
jgi:deoxyribose-phosphate aldolase